MTFSRLYCKVTSLWWALIIELSEYPMLYCVHGHEISHRMVIKGFLSSVI